MEEIVFKPPKLKIVNNSGKDIIDDKNELYQAIFEITSNYRIKIYNKHPTEDIYMIRYNNGLCGTCHKTDCKTGKSRISGNYVVVYCDNNKTEKRLATVQIDYKFLENIDIDTIIEKILFNINIITLTDDIGLADMITSIIVNKIMKRNGSVIYVYNGTTKLWSICTGYDHAAYIISKYFNQILMLILNKAKKLLFKATEEDIKDDITKYKELLEQVQLIIKRVNNLTKLTKVAKVALADATPLQYPSGVPYFFPMKGSKVVDLRTGEILTRREDHCFTVESPYTYLGKEYKCPNMERLMKSIFNGKEEVEYMQMILGNFLSGVGVRCYYIFWGGGHNGKSVLIDEIISKILSSFHVALMSSALSGKSVTGATPELMPLIDARLATISETGKKEDLNAPLVKKLTGGDNVGIRGLNQAPVNFINTAKIVMVTNHPPQIDLDKAIAERTRLIPFINTFVSQSDYDKLEDKTNYYVKDPDFINSIKDNHMDEVFTYLVNGAIKYFSKQDHQIPTSFNLRCEEFLEGNDNTKEFFTEKCKLDITFSVKSTDLRNAYNEWAEMNGDKKLNARDFKKLIEEKGYKYKKMRCMYIMGIRLLTDKEQIEKELNEMKDTKEDTKEEVKEIQKEKEEAFEEPIMYKGEEIANI